MVVCGKPPSFVTTLFIYNDTYIPLFQFYLGKSRADLWSLAAIVAVEWGVETNNMKCDDFDSVRGCHHLQGESGCHVLLNTSIPFKTGRVDCVSQVTMNVFSFNINSEVMARNMISDSEGRSLPAL